MAKIKELFRMYADIDSEKLFANLKYFLERIMPVCDKYDINDLEGEEITRIKANVNQRRNMVRRILKHILSKRDVQVLTAKETIRYMTDPDLLRLK